MQEQTKACSKCGVVKPLSEFVRDATRKNGRRSPCFTCDRLKNKQYRDSGGRAAAARANPMAHQLAAMVRNSRARAQKKGLEHNIDVKYLRSIVTTHCPYSGIELRWEVQTGMGIKNRTFPNSPSLDRLDPSKGYIKGNVVIVSHRANAIKNDATELELIQIARNISSLKMHLLCLE